MPRSISPVATLAAVLALAGGFVSPGAAHAAPGDDAPLLAADPTVGTGADGYDTAMSQTSIQPGGLRQDDAMPDSTLDPSTQERALVQGNGDQVRIQAKKSYRRRPSIFTHNNPGERHVVISPYIEAGQVATFAFAPTHDTTTYSVFAAGVDAAIEGRNNQGMVAVRVERRQGWGSAGKDWAVTGLGRVSSALIQDTLRLDVAGYAGQVRIDGTGASLPGSGLGGGLVQTYAVYAGPSLETDVGQLKVDAHYRIGYASVGTPATFATPTGTAPAPDVFDHSTVQDGYLSAKVRPGDFLPVGLGVSGGYYLENISNLDQQARDMHVRGDVTVPLGDDFALVGGVGYESVKVSSRDSLRDPVTGVPLVGNDGRLQADYTKPRQIALNTEGLIWDAGLTWKPSPRTEAEAFIGSRYGELGGYGRFTYHPTARQSATLLVYNNLSGFGGQMINSLTNLPTQFNVYRDGVTGNISTCASASTGGTCVGSALGSVRSTVYRGRGFTASYGVDMGHNQVGFGFGYDHRTYIAAAGSALAALNGKADNYYWASAYYGHIFSPRVSVGNTLDVYYYQSGLGSASDTVTVRLTSGLSYTVNRHLSASAAASIDGVNRQAIADIWGASGRVGMRYTF